MLGVRSRPLALVFATLLIALALGGPGAATDSAGTLQKGADAAGAKTLAAGGAAPALASFWVGAWTATYGWGALDASLQDDVAAGRAPLVLWYYWGDAISPSCVEYGCGGKSLGQWDAMTQTLAAHLASVLKGAPAYVVLENEFNKNGIDGSSYASTFDGYLAARAATLHSAPGTRVVLGYGGWGEANWGRFPRAIAASDLVGFQLMRASTRDSISSFQAVPDRIAQLLSASHAIGAKGAMLYDLALSSYPDATWAKAQSDAIGAIFSRASEFASNGLVAISYREVDDNPGMDPANYYGYAEQHWGLRDASGATKPAWDAWVAGAGSAAAPASAPAPAPTPPPPPPAFAANFSTNGGNNWWVAARVGADAPLAGVCAAVNGGACQTLKLQSWGEWAASFYVPSGAALRFSATSTSGQTATSGAYAWPTGAPAAPPPSVAFRPAGNSWWVQADLTTSERVAAVCASVNGGACQALKLQSWGGWAASFYVPASAHVQFRATVASGATATSASYAWPPPK